MHHRPSRAAFTLIELLAVVAIIAILAALILGLAQRSQKDAANKRAESEIEQLKSFVEDYRTKYGKIPGTDTALSNALATAKHSLTNMTDPWGEPYHYVAASRFTCYIWSTAGDTHETNRPSWIGDPEPGK